MAQPIYKKFGKKVKEKRTKLGLTHEELATKAGVSINYISSIERGIMNPTLQNMEKIAKALKVDLKELI